MKMTKIAMLILAIALALYILIPSLSWAEDGCAKRNARSEMAGIGAGMLAAHARKGWVHSLAELR